MILTSTFGSFTLCANIPNHNLKSVMGELINFYFNGDDEELILIITFGTIWTNRKEKYRLSFNKASLKLLINDIYSYELELIKPHKLVKARFERFNRG